MISIQPNNLNDGKDLWPIRLWLCLFTIGLIASGATAIPLLGEVNWLASLVTNGQNVGPVAAWVREVQTALHQVHEQNPFLFYGTDWLAFGHFAIAIAFLGPLLDPVRNKWVIDFGIICCVLVIPYAFLFGFIRGIPVWWRLIDCSFGIFGLIPLAISRRLVSRLESRTLNVTAHKESK